MGRGRCSATGRALFGHPGTASVDEARVRRQSASWRGRRGLTRFSRHLTVEARHKPGITALRLLTVLNVGFKYARIPQKMSC